MKVLEIKSVIKELITEEKMFGKKIQLQVGDEIYPALISRNVKSEYSSKPYRITWFYPVNKEPMGHISFNFNELEYILKNKKFPDTLNNKTNQVFSSKPKLIFEIKRTGPLHPTGADILVGTIDKEDGYVDAKYGGTHKTLKVRNNPQGNWRFNDETRIVYWQQNHPKMYEVWVNNYIRNNLGEEVKQHLILDNLSDFPEVYQKVWNDMHGVDSDD